MQGKIIHRLTIGAILIMAVILTISTAGCGKKSSVRKNIQQNETVGVEKFAEDFFFNCNLPYEKIKESDVQNTADEYLFYISDGVVYRTVGDCAVVIVERVHLRERDELAGTNYSGELYKIFEDDDIDLLKYSACGDYALMASLNSISNWEESEIITSFMNYAAEYHNHH